MPRKNAGSCRPQRRNCYSIVRWIWPPKYNGAVHWYSYLDCASRILLSGHLGENEAPVEAEYQLRSLIEQDIAIRQRGHASSGGCSRGGADRRAFTSAGWPRQCSHQPLRRHLRLLAPDERRSGGRSICPSTPGGFRPCSLGTSTTVAESGIQPCGVWISSKLSRRRALKPRCTSLTWPVTQYPPAIVCPFCATMGSRNSALKCLPRGAVAVSRGSSRVIRKR